MAGESAAALPPPKQNDMRPLGWGLIISSLAKGGIMSALRAMDKLGIDVGVFKETKLTARSTRVKASATPSSRRMLRPNGAGESPSSEEVARDVTWRNTKGKGPTSHPFTW